MNESVRLGIPLPDFLAEDARGFVHAAGHRIGLHQLVHYYNGGYSAEMLACEFPSLPLPLVHRCIAFYLEHREAVDRYVAQSKAASEEQRRRGGGGPGLLELRERLSTPAVGK